MGPVTAGVDPGYGAAVPDEPRRNRLVEDHLDYVRALAGQIRERLHPSVEMEDLVAYGLKGLIEAADRFDPRQGVRFTTFSYYRIRGAIFDGLRRMGWVKRGDYARMRLEERANFYLQGLGQEVADADEAVALAGRAIDDLAAIFVTSMDAQAGDQLVDERAGTAEDSAQLGETRERLHEALDTLPPRERQLIDLYYYGKHTLESAGKRLGLSKSWASRLHARAIGRLGRALGGDALARPPTR